MSTRHHSSEHNTSNTPSIPQQPHVQPSGAQQAEEQEDRQSIHEEDSNSNSNRQENNASVSNHHEHAGGRTNEDVGTPSEHSSIVAREPDSTDRQSSSCADCRELRREVVDIKARVSYLVQILDTYCGQQWPLPAAPQQPNSGGSSAPQNMISVAAAGGVQLPWQTQLTAAADAARNNLPTASATLASIADEAKKSKNMSTSPTDAKSKSTPEGSGTSGGGGGTTRQSAPLSNLSTTDSNDDEEMGNSSDSGERSGESTGIVRVAEQLIAEGNAKAANRKRAHEGEKSDEVKQMEAAQRIALHLQHGNVLSASHLAPPSSAPPSGVMQLSPAHMAMLQQHHSHPLVSPPHNGGGAEAAHAPLTYDQLTAHVSSDAKRMRANGGVRTASLMSPIPLNGQTSIGGVTASMIAGLAGSSSSSSMTPLSQQMREQLALASLQKLRDESAIRGSSMHAPSLTKAELKMDMTGQSSMLRQTGTSPPANWQQLLLLQQHYNNSNSSAQVQQPPIDAAMLAALMNVQQQQQQAAALSAQQHQQQANMVNALANKHQHMALQLAEKAAAIAAGQQQQHLTATQNLLARQLPPSSSSMMGGGGGGGGLLSVDMQVQHALDQSMREHNRYKKTIVKPPPTPRAAPDDFVREFVESSRNEEPRTNYPIPVPEANEADASFRPVSEEQILHSVKWHELELQEAVTRLAKKLAEKRVFGPMLMARATVAGTNHSNYSNLPIDGIRYIEDVCRRTLCPATVPRQRFIDSYFRPAMKGLAARCRRIRHSLKPQESRNTVNTVTAHDLAASQQLAAVQALVTQSHLTPSTSAGLQPSSLLLPASLHHAALNASNGGVANSAHHAVVQQVLANAQARARLMAQSQLAAASDATAVTPPATTKMEPPFE